MPEQDLDALLSDDSSQGESHPSPQNHGDQPQVSLEEQEFNKLTGSTQDRVRSLIKRAKSAEAETERMKALAYQAPKLPPPPPGPKNQDVEQALNVLDQNGMAKKDYVDQKITGLLRQIQFENKLGRLEEVENGKDGRPKFDRYEYEDFIRSNPQYQYYDPQDVFGIMYRDELIDWEFSHRSTQPNVTQPLKNSRTSQGTDIWTPEYIEEQIATQGQAWYEKNFDKVQKVLEASRPS